MRRKRVTWRARLAVTAAALMLLDGSLAAAPVAGADPTPAVLAALQKAVAAARAGDCATALRRMGPALDGASGLPEEVRAPLFDIAVSCRLKERQTAGAYAAAMEGTRLQTASDWLWRIRLGLEIEGKRYDDAVTTVVAMTQGRGAALNSMPTRWLSQLDAKLLRAKNVAARRRLLVVLADAAYQPDDPTADPEGFRWSYAGLLYDAGETAAALTLVRQIDSPAIMIPLSLDPRFRSAVPATFDARRALTAHLARLKDASERHPDALGLVIQIASTQRRIGQPEQALATLRVADPTAAGAPAYVDRDEYLNWWWDESARAHAELGEYDQAVAAMRLGSGLGEDGQRNVSQAINLAEMQIRYGHPADALATLAPFAGGTMPVSPYGEMEMRFARGCATARTKTGDPAQDVAFAKTHPGDHPQALSDLLLCVGDLDGAAAAFIARLDDPDRRVGALAELSEYDAPHAAVPADPVASQLPAIKARPDVRAAIVRAGGTRTFNIQRPDL